MELLCVVFQRELAALAVRCRLLAAGGWLTIWPPRWLCIWLVAGAGGSKPSAAQSRKKRRNQASKQAAKRGDERSDLRSHFHPRFVIIILPLKICLLTVAYYLAEVVTIMELYDKLHNSRIRTSMFWQK